jgi:hypothetical protein
MLVAFMLLKGRALQAGWAVHTVCPQGCIGLWYSNQTKACAAVLCRCILLLLKTMSTYDRTYDKITQWLAHARTQYNHANKLPPSYYMQRGHPPALMTINTTVAHTNAKMGCHLRPVACRPPPNNPKHPHPYCNTCLRLTPCHQRQHNHKTAILPQNTQGAHGAHKHPSPGSAHGHQAAAFSGLSPLHSGPYQTTLAHTNAQNCHLRPIAGSPPLGNLKHPHPHPYCSTYRPLAPCHTASTPTKSAILQQNTIGAQAAHRPPSPQALLSDPCRVVPSGHAGRS